MKKRMQGLFKSQINRGIFWNSVPLTRALAYTQMKWQHHSWGIYKKTFWCSAPTWKRNAEWNPTYLIKDKVKIIGKYWFLTSLWLISHPSDPLSNQLRDRHLETVCLTRHICLLWNGPHTGNSHFSHWLQKQFSVMNLAEDIYTEISAYDQINPPTVYTVPLKERLLHSHLFSRIRWASFSSTSRCSPLMGWEKQTTFGPFYLLFFFFWESTWDNRFVDKILVVRELWPHMLSSDKVDKRSLVPHCKLLYMITDSSV